MPKIQSIFLRAGSVSESIGKLGIDANGFPVTVAFGNNSLTAVDAETLRKALQGLLGSVDTGRKLLALLSEADRAALSPTLTAPTRRRERKP